jgi:hypothetical protein
MLISLSSLEICTLRLGILESDELLGKNSRGGAETSAASSPAMPYFRKAEQEKRTSKKFPC